MKLVFIPNGLSEKEINSIKLLINDCNLLNIEVDTNIIVTDGEQLKIAHGPLNGLICTVIKSNNLTKILVRIDTLNKNIIATIPLSYLNKI